MPVEQKKRSGRPRKSEADKAKYQLIAVRVQDYEILLEILALTDEKLVDAFSKMVAKYRKGTR